MTKQDSIVAAIHAAVEASRAASVALVNVYDALRTECDHHHNGTCTMNPEDIKAAGCSFSKCPYTNI